jgi:hypothetical protein
MTRWSRARRMAVDFLQVSGLGAVELPLSAPASLIAVASELGMRATETEDIPFSLRIIRRLLSSWGTRRDRGILPDLSSCSGRAEQPKREPPGHDQDGNEDEKLVPV